jgi:hypothetical protein
MRWNRAVEGHCGKGSRKKFRNRVLVATSAETSIFPAFFGLPGPIQGPEDAANPHR